MFTLQYFLHSGFFEIRAWDLINAAICWFVIVFFGLKYRVPGVYLLLLFLHTLIPFFLVGVLFDYSYMPDMVKYWEVLNLIRSGEMSFLDAFYDNPHSRTVSISAAFYSLFPFPVAASPISIGFYNVFLYIVVFFFSFKKDIFTRYSIWFYFLFPSLALYSSLSLRDMLIFFMMFFSIFYMFKNRLALSLIFAAPLALIKFQNFFLLTVAFMLYLTFIVFDAQKRPVIVSVFSILLLCVGNYIFPIIAPALNLYRRAMYLEDGGTASISSIDNFYSFVIEGVSAAFSFITKPLPFEANGFLQLLQATENIFVVIGLIVIFRKLYISSFKLFIFWVSFLAVSFVVYGLVVFNFGTAVRYRFPFIVIFFVLACHQLNNIRMFKKL